jgi:hypothetical protein
VATLLSFCRATFVAVELKHGKSKSPTGIVPRYDHGINNFTGAQSEFHAAKFIKAFKGDVIKGYAWIPIAGRQRRLTQANRDDVFSWFGEIAGPLIAERVPAPRVFVPIPNSACVIGTASASTVRLVNAMMAYVNGVIWDGLRWAVPMEKARAGGPREPADLYPQLRVVRRAMPGPCVLVDDVATGWGHIKAAAAKLRTIGMTAVFAVTAGQTVHDSVADPFGWVESIVPDWDP